MDNLLSLLIALIFLAGFATPLIHKLAGKKTGLLLAIVPLSLFIVLLLELLQLAPRESALLQTSVSLLPGMDRSEERRVGKECRARRSRLREKKQRVQRSTAQSVS